MLEKSELYPDVELYKPMLVGKKPDNASELMASKKYIAQVKKDGYWYTLIKTKKGQIYLFSRSKSKKTNFYSEKIDNVPHIKEWAEQLPNDTILIGEVYYEGKTSKDTTTIMGCLPEKAVARQKGEYGWIHYYIHDILRYDGIDYVSNETDFEHRYSNLCEYIDIPLSNPNYIEIASSKTGFDMEEVIFSWMENGQEGGVIKLKSGLYLPGKRRPKEMFKIKTEETFDCVIMGFVDPVKEYTGKEIETWQYWIDGEPTTKMFYYGWKAGFVVGLYDGDKIVEVGSITSGMTDELRKDAAEHPENYLGKVIEVEAMSVDKNELSIRHGRFKRIRPDKNVEDCTIESVFG